jgi:hypothetical protein
LSLLRSNSQVRREAVPVFYRECIGNAGSSRAYHWKLVTTDLDDMIGRMKALSASLTQYAPNAIVEICADCPVDFSTVVDAKSKIEAKTRYEEAFKLHHEQTMRFQPVLMSYMDRQVSRPLQEDQVQNETPKSRGVGKYRSDGEIIGEFIIRYYDRGWFRLVGPIASLDWSGLTTGSVRSG